MLIGLDLGSAHIGVVVAASPVLPLRVLDARTLDINKHNLGPAADWVREGADANAIDGIPPDLVVEMGSLYIPKGANEKKARAIAENHKTMTRLLDLIHRECPGPIYQVTTIARRTWSARIFPAHQGGVSDAEASAGLAAHLDPRGKWPLLCDQDRRDAAGALVGWLLGPPQHMRAMRTRTTPRPVLSPVERIAHRRAAVARYVAKTGAKRAARTVAIGCNCGPDGGPRPPGTRGRHARTCPGHAAKRASR